MFLYPQLLHPAAVALAQELRCLPPADAALAAATEHPATIYTPTGVRVDPRRLQELRTLLTLQAERLGYPGSASEAARLEFDSVAAVALHSTMGIPPGEAAKGGGWEFLCCVLLPDLVRWRFPGGAEGTGMEHFLAGRRNVFQRLWWRAHLLRDTTRSDNAYAMLVRLGEDELVQIMERPNLAGIQPLTRHVARGLLNAVDRHPKAARRTLIREAQKRLLRLSSFVSFDTLGDDLIEAEVASVFDQAALAVSS